VRQPADLDTLTVRVTVKPDDQLARESAAQACRGAIFAAIVLAQQAGALDLCGRLYALHSEALAFERVIRDGEGGC
jgi:hypothetical protein